MGFHAFDVSLEMIAAVKPVIQRVAGRDRQHAYRVAAGSARELRAALRVAQLWGYLDDSVVEAVDGILDRELAMLWRLTKP